MTDNTTVHVFMLTVMYWQKQLITWPRIPEGLHLRGYDACYGMEPTMDCTKKVNCLTKAGAGAKSQA